MFVAAVTIGIGITAAGTAILTQMRELTLLVEKLDGYSSIRLY
jgi:CTP synthase (UTP-ammonia lyase)